LSGDSKEIGSSARVAVTCLLTIESFIGQECYEGSGERRYKVKKGAGGPAIDFEFARGTGGPAFVLKFGCPILDGFQGWGFRPVFSCALDFLDALRSI
jgi:hypothetical protein